MERGLGSTQVGGISDLRMMVKQDATAPVETETLSRCTARWRIGLRDRERPHTPTGMVEVSSDGITTELCRSIGR